ncbi:MAG: Smc, chromosome segregation ATPase, chromosome segregation protein [Patescibacteria group bacterium]|nr:Smc, chromosome segregation ATPase, chromosome segregation protein [Patescibacteria group bacterium]
MTLKRLEMHGFKSFAKRAVFDFSAPVTSIVGPNGSGKSNVVEAIRFVLGEQSTKSMRSKTGADLIFKGSKQIGKMSRAMVAITFDNSKRIFSLPSVDDQNLSLDFDEITISREVFADGANKYTLNGNDVRLKDIHELIASVNIGSSGHHIISQGEADRLLNSKPAERREMLEESLGLKLYHYRIKEGERKLEKTREHVREAESIRRELAPHIKFLKKQVEKIEKAREIEIALVSAYEKYLVEEQSAIARKQFASEKEKKNLETDLLMVEDRMAHIAESSAVDSVSHLETEIARVRSEIRNLARNRDDIGRQIGRVEGMIEAAKMATKPGKVGVSTVSLLDIENLADEFEALAKNGGFDLHQAIAKLRAYITDKKGSPAEPIQVDTSEFESSKSELETQIAEIDHKTGALEQQIKTIEIQVAESRKLSQDSERTKYELSAKRNEIASRIAILVNEESHVAERIENLKSEYVQAEALVGSGILDLKSRFVNHDVEINESAIRQNHHEIERMKIRLEDMGGGGSGDVLAEHDETVSRDAFLEREINDLYSAIATLESTIKELKEKLQGEFKTGIVKINREFETFFKLMFGGGEAKLAVVDIEKRKRKASTDETDEEVAEDIEEDEQEKEQGIDIDVSLPRKKVKDLEMLSGGERSLTSIALLFALSQVNPPPFLVLDETDAALDEANSQKYGDMIENLARQTQLVVVTHNRETMSRANILYGVTLGSDDASTLLSIKFEEAVKVAK